MLGVSDWAGVLTSTFGGVFGWTAYNQAAFLGNCAMAQAQRYQEKNYHLGWVAIAREDIRDLMSTSVSRINNYMLVATLILGVAASALTSVNMPETCPDFIHHAFWLNMGVSIAFLSLSIMFAVKGQNSAFLNTMRLLTWEVRPENPAKYDFDYMKQAEKFELDGWRGLFRMPGMVPAHHNWPKSQHKPKDAEFGKGPGGQQQESPEAHHGGVGMAGGGSSPSTANCLPRLGGRPQARPGLEQEEPLLEEIETPTRQLVYLARFGRFMQVWQPFDTHSKSCIGIGLISLAKGSSYFCLGMLYRPHMMMGNFVALSMMLLFVMVVVTIYEQSMKAKTWKERVAVYSLFLGGPVCGGIATVTDTKWVRVIFAPSCFLFHCLLYAACYLVTVVEEKDPYDVTKKFITGPDGQEFPDGIMDLRQVDDVELAEDMVGQHGARQMAGVERREDTQAKLVQKSVSATVRVALLMTTCLWLVFAWATLLHQLKMHRKVFRAKPVIKVPVQITDLGIDWPPGLTNLNVMACTSNEIFVANEYRLFRLPLHTTKRLEHYPCNISRTVSDIGLDCNDNGCHPNVLLRDSPSTLVDCETGEEAHLLQEPDPAKQVVFFRWAPGQARSSILVVHNDKIVQYSWSPENGGYAPQFRRANVSELLDPIVDEDDEPLMPVGIESFRLYGFPPQESAIYVLSLTPGSSMPERWELPSGTYAAAACSVTGSGGDGSATLVLTAGHQPRLLRITTPRI